MADPSKSMPPAHALLARSRNLAADRALAAALPALSGDERQRVLGILLDRNRPNGLAEVVAGFSGYDRPLQELLLAKAEWLSAGIRFVIDSGGLEARLAAINLIRRGGSAKLAYLLAVALTKPCPRTRAQAATVLLELVEKHLHQRDASDSVSASLLAQAVHQALDCWEIHYRTETVVAAMWLADPLEDVILARVAQPRSTLGRAFNELLRGPHDPRTAGYLLRAFRSPELRSRAAQRLGACRDDDMMKAVLDAVRAADGTEAVKALSWLHRLAWLENGIQPLLNLDSPRAEAAVILVGAVGLANERKVALLERMVAEGSHVLAHPALGRLTANPSAEATTALRNLARRSDGALAKAAEQEVQRRTPAASVSPAESSNKSAPADFDAYWSAFDELEERQRAEVGRALRSSRPDFDRRLRGKLSAGESGERVRALRIVRAMGLVAEVETNLYALAHDPDPVVRSAAVGTLVGLDTPSCRRVLRNALNDADARVQANAIEALHPAATVRFADEIRAKLHSPSSRVRANAITSLLETELCEGVPTLLAMLSAGSRDERLSAMWVVERLRLRSLTDHLVDIARRDPDSRVRGRAAEAVRRIARQESSSDAGTRMEIGAT